MRALIQRVSEASVTVAGEPLGRIGPGLLVLVCAMQGDDAAAADRLAARIAKLRIFKDEGGKMNRSVQDIGGAVLAVSQFTLAADTSSGMRPGFSTAAPPDEAGRGFGRLVELCRESHAPGVETGRFGAHMVISLVNDGPVTFLLRS
jgi:D-tyrosyl-tRNA(Tyr) deacylase